MKQVLKYPLTMTDAVQEITCPLEAVFRAFQFQNGIPCVWAEANQELPNYTRKLSICGTGWEIPRFSNYIGTWQEGAYVWHLYEIKS